MRLLAGDIGGTNARLVSYETDDDFDLGDLAKLGEQRMLVRRNYKNEDFPSFSDVLETFLEDPANQGGLFDACCFAVAGPVVNNQINFTNRDGWIIDSKDIEQNFQITRCQLVNDFVATGYGLLALSDDELITLQPGKKRDDAPIALVGAGTGLGECFLSPPSGPKSRLTAYPSEGGHVEFAPRSVVEEELLHFLQDSLGPELSRGAAVNWPTDPSSEGAASEDKKMRIQDALEAANPRVSVERVLSGKGLENIYNFLRYRHPEAVNDKFDQEYNESSERGRLIGKHQYNYPLFKYALDIMFGVYGSEVGNVALKYLPYGGLYIAGGIAPKNVEYMKSQDSLFMERFREKGRMSSIMTDFPVYVVMKEDLGLRGAHIVASRMANELMEEKKDESLQIIANGEPIQNANGAPVLQVVRKQGDDSFRNAVADYPMTYAVVTGTTAVCTAAAMALGAVLLSNLNLNK